MFFCIFCGFPRFPWPQISLGLKGMGGAGAGAPGAGGGGANPMAAMMNDPAAMQVGSHGFCSSHILVLIPNPVEKY